MTPRKRNQLLLALAALGGIAVVFYPDNPNAPAPPSTGSLRLMALGLCQMYMPCTRGDVHYLEMTKGYGGMGTTCGYLPAWLWWRLGCRVPVVMQHGVLVSGLVNRTEVGTELEYHVAQNIAAVVTGGRQAGCWRWMKDANTPFPELGDILYFQDVLFIEGKSPNPREHVAMFVRVDPDGSLVTYDLGHGIQPEGSLSTRKMDAAGNIQFLGSTRRIVGYDSLDLVPIVAEPDLSDHTIGAV